MRRTVKWLRDAQRDSFMRATLNRIKKGESVLVLGKYGCGKTTFLGQVRPKDRQRIYVDSIAPIATLLHDILRGATGASGLPCARYCYEYKEQIVEAADRIVVFVDEAGDLKPKIWPYIKRMMDKFVPIVMAGLPSVQTFLQNNHPDVLNRFKILEMTSLSPGDLKAFYPDIEPDALDMIYSASRGNMRKFDEILGDCRDKQAELKSDKVTVEIAEMFVRMGGQ